MGFYFISSSTLCITPRAPLVIIMMYNALDIMSGSVYFLSRDFFIMFNLLFYVKVPLYHVFNVSARDPKSVRGSLYVYLHTCIHVFGGILYKICSFLFMYAAPYIMFVVLEGLLFHVSIHNYLFTLTFV